MVGIGTLVLGMGTAVIPLTASSAGALAASAHKTTKSPTKCTSHVLGPALRSVTEGSPYKVTSVGCSGDWAYVIFTSGGTKQIDVLEYSKSLSVWVPDNTTVVCHKHLVPGPVKDKACKGGLSQVQ
jgi:hypothetical protein